MTTNLISFTDLNKSDINRIFSLTAQLKTKQQRGVHFTPLSGKSLAMVFYKPSTRTSVSFAVGLHQLGGFPLIFNADDLQLRRGESLADTARVFSRYVDGILIRATRHEDVLELAQYTTIPIINGLTDLEHPCQVVTDIFTIMEKIVRRKKVRIPPKITDLFWRKLKLEQLRIVYIGDGNNVVNSWLLAAGTLGLNFTLCTPAGYEPNPKIRQTAQKTAKQTGARLYFTTNPQRAAAKADIIYTDVWVSMGQETERTVRERVFRPYQVNSELLKLANPQCMVMHCLPAHRGEEITSDVLDGIHSIVFDQAENRLHVQKAILYLFLNKKDF